MFEIFDTIADIEVILAVVLAAVFTGLYAGFFKWRKTRAGRAVMYVFISWVAISLISFLAIWVDPEYWGRPFFRMLGWGAVVFAVCNLIWTLVHYFFKTPAPIQLEPRHTTEIPIVNSREGE